MRICEEPLNCVHTDTHTPQHLTQLTKVISHILRLPASSVPLSCSLPLGLPRCCVLETPPPPPPSGDRALCLFCEVPSFTDPKPPFWLTSQFCRSQQVKRPLLSPVLSQGTLQGLPLPLGPVRDPRPEKVSRFIAHK